MLTSAEYDLLADHYKMPLDPNLINYKRFDDDIDRVFVEKDLEKAPTKTTQAFIAPSILDPKDVLIDDEEQELHKCLTRIGTETRNRRLLFKPYFQDKSKSGFVAATRFRSIFDFMRVSLTDEEFHLINKRFQAGAFNEINFVEFDHVLKRYSGDDQVV